MIDSAMASSQKKAVPMGPPGLRFHTPQPSSRIQPTYHFAFHHLSRLVEVIVNHGMRIEADGVVDRGQEVARVDGAVQRSGGGAVAAAINKTAADAGAGDASGVAVGPVVAAVVVVRV